ncbi:unnamed protein product [Effrenium voratum]|nr:unnamed protein product [Effrenium voratum]
MNVMAPDFSDLAEPGAYCEIPQEEHRAMALPQLRRVVSHAARRCAEEGWTRFGEALEADKVNLYEVTSFVIKPFTEADLGLSYALETINYKLNDVDPTFAQDLPDYDYEDFEAGSTGQDRRGEDPGESQVSDEFERRPQGQFDEHEERKFSDFGYDVDDDDEYAAFADRRDEEEVPEMVGLPMRSESRSSNEFTPQWGDARAKEVFDLHIQEMLERGY